MYIYICLYIYIHIYIYIDMYRGKYCKYGVLFTIKAFEWLVASWLSYHEAEDLCESSTVRKPKIRRHI